MHDASFWFGVCDNLWQNELNQSHTSHTTQKKLFRLFVKCCICDVRVVLFAEFVSRLPAVEESRASTHLALWLRGTTHPALWLRGTTHPALWLWGPTHPARWSRATTHPALWLRSSTQVGFGKPQTQPCVFGAPLTQPRATTYPAAWLRRSTPVGFGAPPNQLHGFGATPTVPVASGHHLPSFVASALPASCVRGTTHTASLLWATHPPGIGADGAMRTRALDNALMLRDPHAAEPHETAQLWPRPKAMNRSSPTQPHLPCATHVASYELHSGSALSTV